MLMTREGSSALAPARSSGSSSWVVKKTPLTLVSRTLSKPSSEYSSMGSPQLAPALLTSMSTRCTCLATPSRSTSQPWRLDRSAGTETHVPNWLRSAAVASQASALRAEMYTVAPACSRPRATISPIPREPPVTTATAGLGGGRRRRRWGWVDEALGDHERLGAVGRPVVAGLQRQPLIAGLL